MLRILVFAVLVGCAPPQRACPDSSTLPCLTARECTWDPVRNCEVCRCAEPTYVPPQKTVEKFPPD